MSQESNNKISFLERISESNPAINPGSYNDFSNDLDNKDDLLRSEIVSLYSSALARYKESLNIDEKQRYSSVS